MNLATVSASGYWLFSFVCESEIWIIAGCSVFDRYACSVCRIGDWMYGIGDGICGIEDKVCGIGDGVFKMSTVWDGLITTECLWRFFSSWKSISFIHFSASLLCSTDIRSSLKA